MFLDDESLNEIIEVADDEALNKILDEWIKRKKKIYHLEGQLKEKIEYLSNNTDYLKSIDINDITQIETDFDNNVYVVLNNGELYINGEIKNYEIDKIYMLDGFTFYKITKSQMVIPMREMENWTNLDRYLYNDGCCYKKIITDCLYFVALTEEGDIIATSSNPCGLGIIPENFKNVDDVYMKDIDIDLYEPYIVKQRCRIAIVYCII